MSVMIMVTKNKKQYYWVGNEWKQLTKEQFQKEYNRLHPLRTKVILLLSKLIVTGVVLAFWFIVLTAVYAVFKWAIGVWI